MSKAGDGLKNREDRIQSIRMNLKSLTPAHLLPSIVLHSRRAVRKVREETRLRHVKKISCLSNDQDKPLRSTQFTVRNLPDKSPPTYVTELLSFGPKHPIKDKFRELHFLADMDKLLVDIGDGDADRQNEINALTVRYNNKMRKQRPDRVVAKTNA